MIKGDENKPMSILERISDEPLDPEPYIDYLLDHHQGMFEHWSKGNNESKELVLHWIRTFIIELENLKRKMNRPGHELTNKRMQELIEERDKYKNIVDLLHTQLVEINEMLRRPI